MKDGLDEELKSEARKGVCPVCGKEFEGKKGPKYCSQGC